MTRNEYLIGLLMESADALVESAGANGAGRKFYDNRIKNIDNKKRQQTYHYLNSEISLLPLKIQWVELSCRL